jgi:hypothetical protein
MTAAMAATAAPTAIAKRVTTISVAGTPSHAEPQPRRPDRLIYAITPVGEAELARWLSEPTPPAPYRDELYLKLVAAANAGAAVVQAVVQSERAALLGELHALRALAASKTPLVALLTEGAAGQVGARLQTLDRAEASAGTRSGQTAPVRVSVFSVA